MHNRSWLLATAALCATAMLGVSAQAQEAAADTQAERDDMIIVSGSRIVRDGFTAPTPTTVLTAANLQQRGATNVGDFLNEIPSFRTSVSNQTNTQSSSSSGATFADLRGLGNIRTLVLVDSRRHVPTAPTGQVDLNMIPTSLVQRIDVVTGGASAAYGSDAISGVVNVIIDKTFTGFKADLSLGVAEQGDNFEQRYSLGFGTSFGGGRGHLVIGGEYVKQEGVTTWDDRDWSAEYHELVSNPANRAAGLPSRFYAEGVRFVNSVQGGNILQSTPASSALNNIYFPAPGQVATFNPGQNFGGSSIDFTSSVGTPPRLGHQLVLPLERYVTMAHLDYDVSDSVQFFAEASYGRAGSNFNAPIPRDTATAGPRAIVIRRDNAFLPAQVASIMDANNITSFAMGRANDDHASPRSVNFNTTWRASAGLSGDLGGSWGWDVYGQYGKNVFDSEIRNLRIQSNFTNALDAITVGGQIVCRNVAARAAGCQPMNVFGPNAMSQASIDYVQGTQVQKITSTQLVTAANIRGEPFSTWAGPVSFAAGAEYRRDKTESVVDPIAQAGGYNFSNPRAFSGEFEVKEGYAEVVVPLARDVPFFKSLELNGAVRYTDYSFSGGVTTWKGGATWQITDDLRLRGTRSRDIRAPNAAELFSVTSTQSTLRNPFSGVTRAYLVQFLPSATLAPERADTLTLGAAFTPTFLPGFSASVDFFDIKINGAIASFPAQQILDRCFAEITGGAAGTFCQSVSLSGTGSQTEIDAVRQSLLNLATLKTRGVDFEASYRTSLGAGTLTTRVFGTYVANLISDDGLGTARGFNAAGVLQTQGSVVDRAGQLGGFTSGLNLGATSVPKWSLNATIGYEGESFGTSLQARWIDGGIIDASLVGPADADYNPASPISIADNTVPSRFYLNWYGHVNVYEQGDRRVQAYMVVNNLLGANPPFPNTALAGFYDRIGRAYRVGMRFTY